MKSLLELLNYGYFLDRNGVEIHVGNIVCHADVSSTVKWKIKEITTDSLILEKYSFGSNSCIVTRNDSKWIRVY